MHDEATLLFASMDAVGPISTRSHTGGGQTMQRLPQHDPIDISSREQRYETPTLADAHEGDRYVYVNAARSSTESVLQ